MHDHLFNFYVYVKILSQIEISENAKRLCNIYKQDLDSDLEMELLGFQQFCANSEEFNTKNKVSKEQAIYSIIIKERIRESFPNVEMVLRIYLTLMISNSSSERSFSKLKVIKNSSRVSMTQKRLNYFIPL